jgi:hypothetical protein
VNWVTFSPRQFTKKQNRGTLNASEVTKNANSVTKNVTEFAKNVSQLAFWVPLFTFWVPPLDVKQAQKSTTGDTSENAN